MLVNYGLLVLASIFLLALSDLVYKIHSRLFPMSREAFNVAIYGFLGVYKILIFVFNLVPWVALLIIS